jgi:MFS family permease
MAWLANDIKAVMWIAVVPGFAAVALLVFGVREPGAGKSSNGLRNPVSLAVARRLPVRYWLIVALGTVFTLARFSEAFLVLRARDVGLSIGYVPLVMIIMNVVYAASAYPMGVASDRVRRRPLLVLGLSTLIAADVVLAAAPSVTAVLVGSGLWGLHMGLTQGLFSRLVADAAPQELRGTAFGVFNFVGGSAVLLSSVIAGWLWTELGASATFIAGAGFATLTTLGLLAYRRPRS